MAPTKERERKIARGKEREKEGEKDSENERERKRGRARERERERERNTESEKEKQGGSEKETKRKKKKEENIKPPIPYKGCSRGPKLGTYSDWGLSSVLVINKTSITSSVCVCVFVCVRANETKSLQND